MSLNVYETIPYYITSSGSITSVRGRLSAVLITAGETNTATLTLWDKGNQRLTPLFRVASGTTDGIQFAQSLYVKNGVSAVMSGVSAVACIYIHE